MGLSYIHSYTMKVVSIVAMLGLGLALALPQYKKQDKGQQGQDLDNEQGPNQDKKVKLVPSFDAVKEAAENEPEEGRDNKLEQEPMFDAVKDGQEPQKCAKEGKSCCIGIKDSVSGVNRSFIEDKIKEAKEDKEAFKKSLEMCNEMRSLDCCEGYYCSLSSYTICKNLDGPY